jgi:hypothetical protein
LRWKLLFLAPLVATVTGAGITSAIIYGLFGSIKNLSSSGLALLGVLFVPIVSIFGASFFVYRHTARRRSLQGMATALMSTALMLLVFFLLATSEKPINSPAPPINPNIGHIYSTPAD